MRILLEVYLLGAIKSVELHNQIQGQNLCLVSLRYHAT